MRKSTSVRMGGCLRLLCVRSAFVAALAGCGSGTGKEKTPGAAATPTPTSTATLTPTEKGEDPKAAAKVDLLKRNLEKPTWDHDVKPFMVQVCSTCHANFLNESTFKEARSAMISAVSAGRMPPQPSFWNAGETDTTPYREAAVRVFTNAP